MSSEEGFNTDTLTEIIVNIFDFSISGDSLDFMIKQKKEKLACSIFIYEAKENISKFFIKINIKDTTYLSKQPVVFLDNVERDPIKILKKIEEDGELKIQGISSKNAYQLVVNYNEAERGRATMVKEEIIDLNMNNENNANNDTINKLNSEIIANKNEISSLKDKVINLSTDNLKLEKLIFQMEATNKLLVARIEKLEKSSSLTDSENLSYLKSQFQILSQCNLTKFSLLDKKIAYLVEAMHESNEVMVDMKSKNINPNNKSSNLSKECFIDSNKVEEVDKAKIPFKIEKKDEVKEIVYFNEDNIDTLSKYKSKTMSSCCFNLLRIDDEMFAYVMDDSTVYFRNEEYELFNIKNSDKETIPYVMALYNTRTIIIGNRNGKVTYLDIVGKIFFKEFQAHEKNKSIYGLQVISKDKFATCSLDRFVCIWDYEKTKVLLSVKKHNDFINDITVKSSILISIGDDKIINLFDTNNNKHATKVDTNESCYSICSLKEDVICVGMKNGEIVVYDLNISNISLFKRFSLKLEDYLGNFTHENSVKSMTRISDNIIAVAYSNSSFCIWNCITESLLKNMSTYSSNTRSIIVLNSNTIVSAGSHDNYLIIWK